MKKNLLLLILFFVIKSNLYSQWSGLTRQSDSVFEIVFSKYGEYGTSDYQMSAEKRLMPNFDIDRISKISTLTSEMTFEDSIYYWKWDSTASFIYDQKTVDIIVDTINYNITAVKKLWNGVSWDNSSRSNYNYDSLWRVTRALIDIWSNGTWIENSLELKTYDTFGNRVSLITQNWDGTSWVSATKRNSYFDSVNVPLGDLYQVWQNNAWENDTRTSRGYDANGNMISFLSEVWDNTTWINRFLDSLTYSPTDKLLTRTTSVWSTNVWEYTWSNNFSYDINGILMSETSDTWWNGSWFDNWRKYYVFDSRGNLTDDLMQYWQNNAWENFRRSRMEYDSLNNRTYLAAERWDTTTWVNSYESKQYFDGNDFLYSGRQTQWNLAGNQIISSDSSYSYTHSLVSVNDIDSKKSFANIFPNPCNEQLYIESEIPIERIEFFSIQGENIMTFQSIDTAKISLDFSHYPSGLYLIRISSKDRIMWKKIIIQ
ncbi:MAG: T9SS type A sorting domain-containing protein [Bacteroidia bacterium]|nr:T9SS type A sorting domain-containing protein [Bacteroidia bacterium]